MRPYSVARATVSGRSVDHLEFLLTFGTHKVLLQGLTTSYNNILYPAWHNLLIFLL